jgi:hypothetical protein
LTTQGGTVGSVSSLISGVSKLINRTSKEGFGLDLLTPAVLGSSSKIFSHLSNFKRLIPSLTLPDIPGISSDFKGFIEKSASTIEKVSDTFKTDIVPVIDAVKMLAKDKSSDKAAIDEVAGNPAYGTLAVADKVNKARAHLGLLNTVISQPETKDITVIEKQTSGRDTHHGPTNHEALSYKVLHAIQSLSAMSPASLVASNDVLNVAKPVPWELNGFDFGFSCGYKRTAGVASSIAAAPVSDLHELGVIANAVTFDGALPVVKTGHLFKMDCDSGNDQGFSSFPPKQDCYDWSFQSEIDVRISSGGALNVLTGTNEGMLWVWVGNLTDGLNTLYKFPIKWEGALAVTKSLDLDIPFSAGEEHAVEMALVTPNVAPVVLEIQARSLGMAGLPKSSSCQRSHIDFHTATSLARQFVEPGTRWIDLFGKVKRESRMDPNFSLSQGWNARSVANTTLVSEIVDAYVAAGVAEWGTSPGAPSINDKYVDKGLNGIADMIAFNSYIYTDGPFAGKTPREINELLHYFSDDLKFAASSLFKDSKLSIQLSDSNAFTVDPYFAC